MVVCPENPVAVVEIADAPPKTIDPDTADEFAIESVMVVPDIPATVAPLATPIPYTDIPTCI